MKCSRRPHSELRRNHCTRAVSRSAWSGAGRIQRYARALDSPPAQHDRVGEVVEVARGVPRYAARSAGPCSTPAARRVLVDDQALAAIPATDQVVVAGVDLGPLASSGSMLGTRFEPDVGIEANTRSASFTRSRLGLAIQFRLLAGIRSLRRSGAGKVNALAVKRWCLRAEHHSSPRSRSTCLGRTFHFVHQSKQVWIALTQTLVGSDRGSRMRFPSPGGLAFVSLEPIPQHAESERRTTCSSSPHSARSRPYLPKSPMSPA